MNHENPIHLLADTLTDYFEGSNAVNYIEQTFTCNQDSSKSFVVTMQKIEGLTPCEKLSKAEKLNADMCEMLEECKSILEGNTYFVKAEKIEQLLKRARGE